MSTLLGTSSSRTIKPDNLITFIMEEAQHHVINDEHTKNVESALTAIGKKQRTSDMPKGAAVIISDKQKGLIRAEAL